MAHLDQRQPHTRSINHQTDNCEIIIHSKEKDREQVPSSILDSSGNEDDKEANEPDYDDDKSGRNVYAV